MAVIGGRRCGAVVLGLLIAFSSACAGGKADSGLSDEDIAAAPCKIAETNGITGEEGKSESPFVKADGVKYQLIQGQTAFKARTLAMYGQNKNKVIGYSIRALCLDEADIPEVVAVSFLYNTKTVEKGYLQRQVNGASLAASGSPPKQVTVEGTKAFTWSARDNITLQRYYAWEASPGVVIQLNGRGESAKLAATRLIKAAG